MDVNFVYNHYSNSCIKYFHKHKYSIGINYLVVLNYSKINKYNLNTITLSLIQLIMALISHASTTCILILPNVTNDSIILLLKWRIHAKFGTKV